MQTNEFMQAIEAEINARYDVQLEKLKTPEGLNQFLLFNGKKYKNNEHAKAVKYSFLKRKKDIAEFQTEVKKILEAQDFSGEFVITVEWKNSYMWGKNPTAHTNHGFKSRSIGGCGYCKISTATAEALNSNLSFLKLMLLRKIAEHKPGRDHRDYIGYGSGHGHIPRFEGGVGTSSHQTILKNLGLKMEHVTNTGSIDVFIVKREGVGNGS